MPGPTLSNTVNFSGMLWERTDNATRFLDAIYMRGRNGGRVTNYSQQFILASGYSLSPGAQPNISEQASMLAPTATTVERDQETNVNQIFIEAAEVSYVAQSNRDALSGLNLANQTNNRQNMLAFQVGTRVDQMRINMNYTMLNGIYQFTPGSTTVAPRTRGLIPAIQTCRFDAAGAEFDDQMLNDALVNAVAKGCMVENLEIWVNPMMFPKINKYFTSIPGFAQPTTRTEGGVAIVSILTHLGGIIPIYWEPNIPNDAMLLVNMGQMAVSEKPYFDMDGNNLGVLFYQEKEKPGASEGGMVYAEVGCDYGAEWHHIYIENIG